MGSQPLSPQSFPSFRSTDLALPLFPGSCMRKPFTRHNPETPMPPAPATLSRSKKFSLAPAAVLPTQPAPHLPTDSAPPASEIEDRRVAHAPALPLFVLVKRRPALDTARGRIQSRYRGAKKRFPPSVLAKQVRTAFVFLAPVFAKPFFPTHVSETLPAAQRERDHRWALRRIGTLGRTCWARMAGQFSEARQIVSVKSFSSACNAPRPPFCDPGAGFSLNEWGVRRA